MQSKASEGKPTAQWLRSGQDSAWTCARKRCSCKLPQKKILNSAQCTELVTPETSSVQKPWPIADSQLCPCLRCVVPVQRAVQRTTQRCNLRRFVLAGKKKSWYFLEWAALVSPKHKNHCKLQRCVVCCTVCCTVFRNVSHCFALLRTVAHRMTHFYTALRSDSMWCNDPWPLCATSLSTLLAHKWPGCANTIILCLWITCEHMLTALHPRTTPHRRQLHPGQPARKFK